MHELEQRIARLSPAKRALLQQWLQPPPGLIAGSIPQRTQAGPSPLSFAQEGLWFLDQLAPGLHAYNIPSVYWIKGSLDTLAFERSLGEILRRHAALRTAFVTVDGAVRQDIGHRGAFKLSLLDLQRLPPDEQQEQLRQARLDDVQRPFDLERGQLLRATLVKLAEDESVLLMCLHHIAADGWSVGILHRELSALYAAFARGQPSPLAELPIQYVDFAAWQREWLQGEVLAEQLRYWKRQLTGAPPVLELPTDRPRPATQTYRGAQQCWVFDPQLLPALEQLSRQEGVTLFMTLLAAFQTLLYRYSGQEDVVVGTPIAGRQRLETEELIGFFVNTLVLRSDLSGNPTFRELLGRVREVTLGAYAHQDLPFEKLVEELNPQRNLSYAPLFQVMLVLQNAPQIPLSLPGLKVNAAAVEQETAKFDLTFELIAEGTQLRGTLNYNCDLFAPATMERLLGHFQTLLEGIAAQPEQRIGELPLLSAAERHELLVTWNDTQTAVPPQCVHELFAAQVERTPEAVAIEFAGQPLTYRQLNVRANQLAHYLQERGVGPEVRVGVCLERSLDLVVALLGILKAGGAYVPLDPAYPRERLAFMLQDSQAPLLVTQHNCGSACRPRLRQLICLDEDAPRIAAAAADDLGPRPVPRIWRT